MAYKAVKSYSVYVDNKLLNSAILFESVKGFIELLI